MEKVLFRHLYVLFDRRNMPGNPEVEVADGGFVADFLAEEGEPPPVEGVELFEIPPGKLVEVIGREGELVLGDGLGTAVVANELVWPGLGVSGDNAVVVALFVVDDLPGWLDGGKDGRFGLDTGVGLVDNGVGSFVVTNALVKGVAVG